MPGRLRTYFIAVGLLGLGALPAYLAAHLPAGPGGLAHLALRPEPLLVAAAAAAFEIFPVLLPNGQPLSLSSAFTMTSLVLFGPVAAVLVNALCGLATRYAPQRQPWPVILFNAGLYAGSAMGLSATFLWAGGRPGELRLLTAGALTTGACMQLLINISLIALAHWIGWRRSPWQAAIAIVREGGAVYAFGTGFALIQAYGLRTGGWPQLAVSVVMLLAFRYAVSLYMRQKKTYLEALAQLTSLAFRGSSAGGAHVDSAGLLARQLAQRLRLPPAEIDLIHTAALLHDIGELRVEDRTVSKVYRRAILTASEQAAYRQHVLHGAEMAARISGLDQVGRLVRHHHEHWDGSGYPDGLQGEEIPLGARILGAAEAYLMAVHGQDDLGGEERRAYVQALAGTVIDPKLATLLADLVGDGPQPVVPPTDEQAVAAVYSRVQESVRQSQLLESLGIGYILTYRAGEFFDPAGRPATPPLAEQVAALASRAQNSGRVLREHLVQAQPEAERVFDVYCIPVGRDLVNVLIFDVTEALAMEREQRHRLERAYSDVIAAVTRGRLLLLGEAEAAALLAEGEPAGTVVLDAVNRAGEVRSLVTRIAREQGLPREEIFRLALCATEASGNVFKHAGTGWLQVRLLPGRIRVVVSDTGSGIPLDILPQAILVDGFSTQISLGKGYSLMLHYMDRLLIRTGPSGTTVVLEKKLGVEQPPAEAVNNANAVP